MEYEIHGFLVAPHVLTNLIFPAKKVKVLESMRRTFAKRLRASVAVNVSDHTHVSQIQQGSSGPVSILIQAACLLHVKHVA